MKKLVEPVARESMASHVKQTLLQQIMNGDLLPGTRLMELHIAAQFQTSQTPIREALRELEALGLVRTEPYRGSRVREVSPDEIREAYVVRSALEDLGGRLAAPHLKGSTTLLEESAASILKAARHKDIAAYTRADIAFHRAIMEASGNSILLRSWEALRFEISIQFRLSNSRIDLVRAQEAHWPVIDALKSGNGKQAGRLLRDHVLQFSS